MDNKSEDIKNNDKVYACIDLKSFYASVECVERGLDPLKTNLVVADKSRTEKTICLAVSPSLKAYGISGRCRLFELVEIVRRVNYERRRDNNYKKFVGKSFNDVELKSNKLLELDYIVAPPRMAHYMRYSTKIYDIYLKYIAPEDMFVYSIDEVFFDITNYLKTYNKTPSELVTHMIKDVYDSTGITATAGIGTNLFLAKVAMDVIAKKKSPNEFGVRIGILDEMSYRRNMWNHRPLTDIWRIGRGIAVKLEKYGMFTLGDVASKSLYDENLLYRLFGVNAELIIDHAWGYEPVTMKDIKEYRPRTTSISTGQVLHAPTSSEATKIIVKEMADALSLDLVRKHYVTNQIVLTIQYDVENLLDESISREYKGEIMMDYLGRKMPKHAHGTVNFDYKTSSTVMIVDEVSELFDKIVNPLLLCRKINISANNLTDEDEVKDEVRCMQLTLFDDMNEDEELNLTTNSNNMNLNINTNKKMKSNTSNCGDNNKQSSNQSNEQSNKQNNKKKKRKFLSKKEEMNERKIQRAVLDIKDKYGKNAIVKGMNLLKGATGMERNKQIGGHHE